MRDDEGGNGWSFNVKSSYRGDQNAKSTVHSKGRLGFSNVSTSSTQAWIKSCQRLVTCRTEAVSESLDIETFRSQRAYTLFSRVVNCSGILKRISVINIAGSEAIAEVHTIAQIHNKESTVTQRCDTVTLDNFIQVAGLLVNTGDDLSLDDAFIASGIEMVSISVSCDFSKEASWRVYTMITQHSFSKVTADVFVVNTNGSLVVAIIGVNFSRLPLRQIGLSLERVNQTLSGGNDSRESPKITSTTFESDTSTRVTTPDKPTKPKVVGHERDGSAARLQESHSSKEAWPQRREDLATLMAEIMGIEQSAVNDNVSLECLGFDSLSLMELKSEIGERIPFQLENDFDAKTTVSALQGLLVSDARSQGRSHAEHHQAASTTSPLRPQNTARYQKKESEHLSPASPGIRQNHDLVTIPYKTVNDLEIFANVYFPKQPTHSKPMAIALMIHGGGFMTMSRTAIRPWQTSHLLEHSVLPVSIDHRLCPEINIIEGPMADVRDALTWVRNDLPTIASKHNISLDSQRVAVIGWSTGGHLAMGTAWTTIEANLEPPQAILNFYGPSDFQSEVWKNPRAIGYPERTMSMQEIRSHLSPKPISTHHIPNSESQFAGLCPGDARSELVLETLKAENFVSILLRGMPANEDQDLEPTPDEIAAISPLVQVRKGIYKTPTCIVHGSEDEVVACRMSQEFGEALASSGVPSEVVVVPGAKHMHDFFLKPGKSGWEDGVASAYGFLFEHLFA